MRRARRVLPGLGLSLGITASQLALLVLLPASALGARAFSDGWEPFWRAAASPRAIAAYQLTFGTAAGAAVFSTVVGLLIAWVLSRYEFPGRALMDGLVDLPFALPTAVAGIVLTSLYHPHGALGELGGRFGWQIAFTPWGIMLAQAFVGMPFVIRMVQPVIEELEVEVEEASLSLGATRPQTFWRVLLPVLTPALVTGGSLALARGVGEYGSVVFIAGNMPMKTEVVSLLIVTKLEQFDYVGAAAIGFVMLAVSFVALTVIDTLQRWVARTHAGQGV